MKLLGIALVALFSASCASSPSGGGTGGFAGDSALAGTGGQGGDRANDGAAGEGGDRASAGAGGESGDGAIVGAGGEGGDGAPAGAGAAGAGGDDSGPQCFPCRDYWICGGDATRIDLVAEADGCFLSGLRGRNLLLPDGTITEDGVVVGKAVGSGARVHVSYADGSQWLFCAGGGGCPRTP